MPEQTSETASRWIGQVGIDNLIGIAALLIAVLVAITAHRLLFKLLRRIAANSGKPHWPHLVDKVYSVARLAAIILAVKLTLPLVQMPPTATLAISKIITLGIIATIGWAAIMAVKVLTDFSIARHRIDVENNLEARKIRTRLRVLRQAMSTVIVLVTIGAMLMVFPGARSLGVSLFASAGVAGLVVGLAARPVLSNLLAGIQIALTQPIRIQDAVIVEGEFGVIEEITSTYVVVKIWDWRRLIVPLSHFIEKPFQNWTRESSSLIGAVSWFTDYSVPVAAMREKFKEFLAESKLWDGDVQALQIIDSGRETLEVRALMSARNAGAAFDLRCEVREKMILWLQQEHPGALPRNRVQLQSDGEHTRIDPHAQGNGITLRGQAGAGESNTAN